MLEPSNSTDGGNSDRSRARSWCQWFAGPKLRQRDTTLRGLDSRLMVLATLSRLVRSIEKRSLGVTASRPSRDIAPSRLSHLARFGCLAIIVIAVSLDKRTCLSTTFLSSPGIFSAPRFPDFFWIVRLSGRSLESVGRVACHFTPNFATKSIKVLNCIDL